MMDTLSAGDTRAPDTAGGAMLLESVALTLRAGARSLVAALDLAVAAGQRWAILGPNGAGKSTLLAALAGARLPDAGEVRYGGRRADAWEIEQLAAQRALAPDGWLDPFSARVIDTVITARYRLGSDDAKGEQIALALLQRLDCAALAERDVRGLSRGERQRVAIATALAQDTPLVLLDEPTAHQDPRHQALVLDQLATLPGRTYLMSLHDINAAARFATHVLLLTGNGAWSAGPAKDILTADRLGAVYRTAIRVLHDVGGLRYFVADSSSAAWKAG